MRTVQIANLLNGIPVYINNRESEHYGKRGVICGTLDGVIVRVEVDGVVLGFFPEELVNAVRAAVPV